MRIASLTFAFPDCIRGNRATSWAEISRTSGDEFELYEWLAAMDA